MSIKKHVDLDTLANVVSAIPSNIFFKDTELRYVFSSHIWEQVDSGGNKDFDIYGKTDRDIRKDTANLDNVEKTDKEILKTGIGTRYTIKSELDGHIQYLELVKEPVRDNDGNIIGIVGLINDVTSVTQEIRDMLENEKAYRNTMKIGSDLAYNVNLTTDTLEEDLLQVIDDKEINLLDLIHMKAPCSYSEMLEKYTNTVLCGPCREEYLELHNPQKLIELYNEGQREIIKELKLRVNGVDGVQIEIWSFITILLMRNIKNEIIAFILINDVTEQRRKEEAIRVQLEENVREAERVANMKSDFLANMSHEIRTPMNAVIGMAEIALRQDLPDEARDCINQIKASGNALLNIINDILDFSKIESGKMDIIPENYDPLSAIHDVSGILMNRIADKNVELLCTVNPNLPIGLYGDYMRIRQVLINLANNAIKFTQEGYVHTVVDFEKTGEDEIMLNISVEDTGIGIKEEDIDKLFVSFQQVDSKRNRNIEGTGLGLAICEQLVNLMGGTIKVSSEYGKGSTFSFSIPQKITDWTPSLSIKDKEEKILIGYWDNELENEVFYDIINKLDVENYKYEEFCSLTEAQCEAFTSKKKYLITNYNLYKDQLPEYVKQNRDMQFIVICDDTISAKEAGDNVFFIKKPLSTVDIAMAINNELFHMINEGALELDFIAPDAKVLIVDDNEVNLVVAEGLLEPLNMQITTALSGKQALELIETVQFDIIFMDHMMPELDGVETTRIIRRFHPEYKDVPIIALSANAVKDARNMFLSEGMNDFIAKPIEIRTITNTIRQWLPKDKIVKSVEGNHIQEDEIEQEEQLIIGDLDIEAAISLIGSQKVYLSILEKYANTIKSKAETIKNCEITEDIRTYTIEVHALKSSSKQVGAMELSAMAAELEACGNAEDITAIHEKTDAMLDKYLSYYGVLSLFFKLEAEQEKVDKPEISLQQLSEFFEKMLEATEELDMDAMEEVSCNIDSYKHEGKAAELNDSLKIAVSNVDIECIEDIISQWKEMIEL